MNTHPPFSGCSLGNMCCPLVLGNSSCLSGDKLCLFFPGNHSPIVLLFSGYCRPFIPDYWRRWSKLCTSGMSSGVCLDTEIPVSLWHKRVWILPHINFIINTGKHLLKWLLRSLHSIVSILKEWSLGSLCPLDQIIRHSLVLIPSTYFITTVIIFIENIHTHFVIMDFLQNEKNR